MAGINTARWFGWGISVFSGTIAAIVGVCFYWLVVDRSPPASDIRGEVVGHERQANGSYIVFVRWSSVRHRYCPGNSRRWLVDGALVPLADIAYPPEEQRSNLGKVQWEVPVEVPGYLVTTGHVRLAYRILIEYACNPLQEIIFPIRVEPPPVPFEILPDGTVRPGNGP